MVTHSINSQKKHFYLEDTILILLLIVSLTGVWITDHSPVDGYGYWMAMVFVFALSAITISWLQTTIRAGGLKKILREQCLHWLTSLLIMEGIYTLFASGHLSSSDAGLVIMLLLSQSTILDGLRIGWRFSLVGVFLGISAMIAVNTPHFFWIGLAIALFILLGTIAGEIWLSKRA